jgi:predicted Zn-dependent protease
VGKDREQGAETAKLVEQQIGIYSSPRAQAYLDALGQRLATVADDSRWEFKFQIVDQSEPNAFAIPGGGIYVSRGLLALATSEDELAGVLGHEIAHVTERHSARQQKRGFLPRLLTLPGNVVGGVVGENLGNLINAPINTVGGAWLSKYSRGQESDADKVGLGTAARAGYEPAALAVILKRLEQDMEAQTGDERRFSIFDSHPMTDSRVRKINKRVSRLKAAPAPPIAANQAAFYAKLDGMWWGENVENGLFRDNRFLHPTMGFTITFPHRWQHKNTPEYVISVHPQKEAMVLLGVLEDERNPEALGTAFVKDMKKRAGLDPVTTRSADIGSFPAYVVTYLYSSGRAAAYLHFAWVSMEGVTYQMVGLAPEKHRQLLRAAALSLRPLTETERRTVTGKRLRIVPAQDGEHLAELGARSGNAWPPGYTALVNGVGNDVVLKEGQLIKIVREERLFK